MTMHLYLDSDDSFNPDTPHNCLWKVQGGINDTNISSMTIDSLTFNNTRYPINRFNNRLVFEEDGAASTVTLIIPENLYTATQLASYLSTNMTSESLEGNTYTVTYDLQSKKLTFVSAPNDFRITEASTCLSEIGLGPRAMAADTSLVMPYPVNLNGSQYIDLLSNISNSQFSSDARSNRLLRFPLNAGFGEVVSFRSLVTNDRIMINNRSDLSNIEFRLIDDRGNAYELAENSPVSYVILLE